MARRERYRPKFVALGGWRLAGAVGALTLGAWMSMEAPAAEADAAALVLSVDDPRAFGHMVGDVVTRRVVIEVPRRLTLDESTLPRAGRVGQSFELRAVEHRARPTLAGARHTLSLRYQIFRATQEPRVLDLPSFVLRFNGEPRAEELRVDFAPVGITPLSPAAAVLRQGLGSLRPDLAPPRVSVRAEQIRLAAYGTVAAGLLVYLSYTVWGWAWWQRRSLPFTQALRAWGTAAAGNGEAGSVDAWRRMHKAFDATAGHVLDLRGIDAFVTSRPRYAPLREELRWFFQRSQAVFFAGEPSDAGDTTRLRALCRHCAAIERGLA